jgi:hypothetical protein
MAEMTWAAAGLLLMVPTDMAISSVSVERVAVLNLSPPVLGHTNELFCSWRDREGRQLSMFWWNATSPPRDFGPMAAADEWDGQLAGRPVKIARTSMFMARKKEVLTASVAIEDAKSSLMIYGEGFSRETFDRIARTSHLIEGGLPQSFTCEPRP